MYYLLYADTTSGETTLHNKLFTDYSTAIKSYHKVISQYVAEDNVTYFMATLIGSSGMQMEKFSWSVDSPT